MSRNPPKPMISWFVLCAFVRSVSTVHSTPDLTVRLGVLGSSSPINSPIASTEKFVADSFKTNLQDLYFPRVIG
jgi:hypothetical protein